MAVVTGLSASPAAAATTLSGTASPMWQTNNPVDALVVSNGVIFAGGTFTSVRPPGSPAGSNETARRSLAAFNASTGALISTFNMSLNGPVKDLAVSPDGTRLYVAGSFTSVGGATRNRLAAVNLSGTVANLQGTVNTAFNPSPNNVVWSVAASATTVWFSGNFTTLRSTTGTTVNRANIASVSAANGALNTAFNPTLVRRPDAPCRAGTTSCPASGFTTYDPHALAIRLYDGAVGDPTDDRLLVGGQFMGVNGDTAGGMASLDPVTGATEVWNANTDQPINTNCAGRVTDIAIEGSNVFVTGEGDPPGCYEGTYSAKASDGTLNWLASCLGASQGITVMNGVLYKASHQHDCALTRGGALGGFVGGTSRGSFVHRYLVGQDTSTGAFVHWYPNTNASGSGAVGPHTITNDGSQVVVGGDFRTVNGAAQQGLTRFTSGGDTATPRTPGLTINADPWPNTPTTVAMSLPVRVQPTAAGTLTVEVPAVEDSDTGLLTYRVYRDGSSTPIAGATQQAESWPWSRPIVRYDDTNLVPGSTHSYRIDATDGVHTSAKSTAVSGTVAAAAPPATDVATSALSPLLFYRLGDASGSSTAADSSGGNHNGTYVNGATPGAPGAVTSDSAASLDGTTGYVASTDTISAPTAFSESAWFKTTSATGGVIVAQTDQSTGSGGVTDRMLTMDNNGNIVFALKANAPASPFGVPTINVRNQGPVWNDGKWHQVVGTYNGNGTMTLYVDGQLQGAATGTPFDPTAQAAGMNSSYVRAGYADVSSMQLFFGINFYHRLWPVSPFFQGNIDEVAVYNTALSAGQVQGLFAAGVGGGA